MAKLFSDNAALDRWIRGVGQGDRDALTQLYQATYVSVYAFALSIVKNHQDAEDVLQDCYLAVCRGAKSYRSQGKAMVWILTLARNLSYKLLQERKHFAPWPEDLEIACPGLDLSERLLLKKCMDQLTEEDRTIVILHVVAQWKHRQIAEYLQLPLATVLSKYHRAMKKLKQIV